MWLCFNGGAIVTRPWCLSFNQCQWLNKGLSVFCDASRMLATCEEERTSLLCFYSCILARASDIKLLVLVLSVWVDYILMYVTLCVTLESTKGCRGGISNHSCLLTPVSSLIICHDDIFALWWNQLPQCGAEWRFYFVKRTSVSEIIR